MIKNTTSDINNNSKGEGINKLTLKESIVMMIEML